MRVCYNSSQRQMDFFYKEHWKTLPTSWQNTLSVLETDQIANLLTNQQLDKRHVPPLSLLAFQACCETFSLDRRCESNIQAVIQQLRGGNNKVGDHSLGSEFEEKKTLLAPIDTSGQLHAYFRKHVKPKKQHEIMNLGKVIQAVADHIDCENVVDVGSGLGHLARLLAFGFGLKVTSVEAADTHAPKAAKYDNEIDREIKKKMEQEGQHASLPCHVTSMIYPHTTAAQFISLINSQREHILDTQQLVQDNTAGNGVIRLETCTATSQDRDAREGIKPEQMNDKVSATCGGESQHLRSKPDQMKVLPVPITPDTCGAAVDSKCVTNFHCKRLSGDSDSLDLLGKKYAKLESNDNCSCGENRSKSSTSQCKNTDITCCNNDSSVLNASTSQCETVVTNCETESKLDGDLSEIGNESKLNGLIACPPIQADGDVFDKHSIKTVDMKQHQTVLTGLHACGDLTPTFLRFYVNCSSAVGLASVGCCYMKVSDQSCTEDQEVGYPMSDYIASIPDHPQSYAARELACHFADTYYSRLKGNSPHLKIHSYRAALEWLANKVRTDFTRIAVQIPAKKANKMDFESYARRGFEKLGLHDKLITPEILQHATHMTTRWKDVVAFYTLRLALAPAVETLLLIDRMIFLYENGHQSALVPIFDPALSPRNFVLLSTKTPRA